MKIRQQRVITYRFPGARENAKKLGVSYSAFAQWLMNGSHTINADKRARVVIVETDGRGRFVPIRPTI